MAHDVALLVIDVQMGLVTGEPPIARAAALLATLAGLIGRARAAGVPVIYVQDDDVATPGTPEWEVHPAIAPRPDELRVRKLACDSFHETTLHAELGTRGIRRLIVAGCKTQYCIDTTCRRAVTLGYPVTLVGDAHGTNEGSVLTAAQIIAHENVTLEGFGVTGAEIEVVSAAEVDF